MADREKQADIEIQSIAEHTRQRLEQLEVEYRIPDKIKKTSGFIAYIWIGATVIIIILNDLANLICFLRSHRMIRRNEFIDNIRRV